MKRTWRICIVAPGASTHAKRWVEALRDRGHEILLVTEEPPATTAVSICAPYQRMGRWRIPKLHHLIAYAMIRRAIRAFRPDFVHMHSLDARPLMLLQARKWRRFVISAWGSDVLGAFGERESERRIGRKKRMLAMAQQVTATTPFLADRMVPLVTRDRTIRVVPFGVDTSRFVPLRDRPAGKEVVIGFLKHFAPTYGPDVLIESMVHVRRVYPHARLVMLGHRDPKPYRLLAERLNLSEVVTFSGPIDHEAVPGMLGTFDIFCMPSRMESFGVAALEASACGVPVVATRVGGVVHAVDPGSTGLLVEPGDPRALAEALMDLIAHPARRRAMGEKGRRWVIENFEWSRSVEQMEAVYGLLIAADGAQRAEETLII